MISLFSKRSKKEEKKIVSEKDLLAMQKSYAKWAKEFANKDENQSCSNGGKEYAIILYKELFNHTNNIVRIFCNNDNNIIWEDKEFITFINNIILEKNLILRIVTTDRMFFDNLDLPKFNVFISETTEKGLKSIYEHFRNEHCGFTVFDDKGYRYEYDTEKIRSFANFNDKEAAKMLINLFENSTL